MSVMSWSLPSNDSKKTSLKNHTITDNFVVFHLKVLLWSLKKKTQLLVKPLLLTEENKSYRFGKTWEWVNSDRIVFVCFFGRAMPLRSWIREWCAWVYTSEDPSSIERCLTSELHTASLHQYQSCHAFPCAAPSVSYSPPASVPYGLLFPPVN